MAVLHVVAALAINWPRTEIDSLKVGREDQSSACNFIFCAKVLNFFFFYFF